jgi:hypothetical protein
MSSHTTKTTPSDGQNQNQGPPDVQSEFSQAQDQTEPESEVSAQLESSNHALKLKLEALRRELEETKAEISAVDHVLEVASKSSS